MPYYYDSKPRETRGGIKINSKKGKIGNKWWSDRFINILKSFGWESRLQRGRKYARSGQVLNINISNGIISADVQGSRKTPYKVKIEYPYADENSWNKIIESIKSNKEWIIKLLNGEFPEEMEKAFKVAGSPLFPENPDDIEMHCNCPDSAIPCKHIAAVFYVLADNFDSNPFILLQLKGKELNEINKSISGQAQSYDNEKKDIKKVLLNFWSFHPEKIKNNKIDYMLPFEKYPLPEDLKDPAIINLLNNYYKEISDGIKSKEESNE